MSVSIGDTSEALAPPSPVLGREVADIDPDVHFAPLHRGLDLDSFAAVADIISHALRPETDQAALDALRTRVDTLAMRFPLYPNLTETTR